MKIVIFWEYLQHYHCARLKALFNHAKTKGHIIVPVAFSDTTSHDHRIEMDEFLNSKVRVLLPGEPNATVNNRRVWEALNQLLDDEHPDVVSIIGWSGVVVRNAFRWCLRSNVGAIMMFETQEKDQLRRFYKELFKRYFLARYVDCILCGGKSHADYARKLGFPDDRIRSCYDVVDNDGWARASRENRENRSSLQQALGLPAKYMVSSGRMIEKKNFAGLVEAYGNYLKSNPKYPMDLVLVGDGPLRPQLERLVKDLNLSGKVHFPGYLKLAQAQQCLALAELFVLASSHYEQWGLVVNEAMASGLPVLVSDICGCAPDLVIEGVTGHSFNPACADDLSSKMLEMANDENKLAQMGVAASQHINNFGLKQFGTNMIELAELAVDRQKGKE